MGEARALPYNRIPINKHRRNDGSRKSPLGKPHSKTCCKPESSVGAKSSRQKYEKQDVAKSQSYLATTDLLTTQGKQ